MQDFNETKLEQLELTKNALYTALSEDMQKDILSFDKMALYVDTIRDVESSIAYYQRLIETK